MRRDSLRAGYLALCKVCERGRRGGRSCRVDPDRLIGREHGDSPGKQEYFPRSCKRYISRDCRLNVIISIAPGIPDSSGQFAFYGARALCYSHFAAAKQHLASPRFCLAGGIASSLPLPSADVAFNRRGYSNEAKDCSRYYFPVRCHPRRPFPSPSSRGYL